MPEFRVESKCGLILLKKWLYLASEYFEKNIAKKYQKQQIVNILWRILRPKQAIFPYFKHILRTRIGHENRENSCGKKKIKD